MLKNWLFFLLFLIATLPVLAKSTLTVYTYDSFSSKWGPGPSIKKMFESQCDCELKFVTLEDSVALLNRLRLEGKNSKADVVLGLDNNLLQAAQNTELFALHNIDTSALNLPGGWYNKTFLPYDYGYFAFIYDKTKLQNPPHSLHELVDRPSTLKIIYEDPRTSTAGLGLLLWMQKVYGDEVSAAWQKLARKTVTVTKGWSESYGLFLKGEADMVLSYTTSPAYHFIEEKKDQYAAISFSEGHYQQVEIAAKLKNSKHPALAHTFLQFMISPAFQQKIPTGNWMYPVVSLALPAGFEQPLQQTLNFTPQEVANERTEWVKRWQRAVSR